MAENGCELQIFSEQYLRETPCWIQNHCYGRRRFWYICIDAQRLPSGASEEVVRLSSLDLYGFIYPIVICKELLW